MSEIDPELGDLGKLSRAELEPVMWRRIETGDHDGAAAIRVELASRTWQGHNPYAGPIASPDAMATGGSGRGAAGAGVPDAARRVGL